MADLLEIKAVKSTNDKVDRVEFHPVQPWLVFVTRGNGVTVWNYESSEVIYENELGGADEAALQEAALQQRAVRDPSYYGEGSFSTGPAAEASLAAKSTASGTVKDVKFFDLDTCFWQLARQHRMQHNVFDSSTIPPYGRSGGISALHGRRWLVMACESKLVLHDLASWESRDLSRSALLESKAPTCLALLLYNMPQLMGYDVGSSPLWFPLLAVGTSGGSIYVVNHEKMVVYAKLSGAHSKAVTALVPIGGETPGSADMLISASADGSVAVWNPSHASYRGADREMAAKLVFKAHEASVHSMTLFSSYSEGSQPPSLKLATVGEDKRVNLWDTRTWKQLGQSKPLQKGSCHSVVFAPWGGAALGVHPSLVLCTGEVPVILGLNPSNLGVMIYADLAGKIDAGQKKTPKIYHAAVHPTRPTLMAVASNTGAVLLSFDPHQRPPVVALPPQVLTLEGLLHNTEKKEKEASAAAGGGNAAGTSKGAQALTYVMALGSTLFSTALRLESKSRSGGGTPSGVAPPERSVHIEAGAREAIGQLDHSGRVVLGCSTSGRSLSVAWPELRAYTIFSLAPTGSWEVIDKGSGNCVVWSSTQPMYAIISVPNIPTAPSPKHKKGLFGKGRKKREEEEAASEAAAARAAAAATSVQVHVVNESAATQFVATHEVPLAGEQPVVLHGGALLGVVLNKRSAMGRAFQFVNWKGFGAVGPELPEPLWVSWEPECTLVALAYAHTIELCRTRPSFERFASLSIGEAQSGIWQSRQLFVSTPTSIHAIFADPVQQFVQAIQLASFQAGASSKLTQAGQLTPLPPEDMRPAGPIVLAGVRHSYLWLADSLGRPFTLSLRHPGIRLRALAARGELSTARTIAQRGLHPGFHDDVARFLAAMSPEEGVREALLLPGLTPPAEMAMSIRAGKWDRAARCFQALALGVADKAVLALAGEGGAGGREVHRQRSGIPVPETYQEDAVNEILEQHARGGAQGSAGLLSLSPPSPQQAQQAGQAQPNGMGAGAGSGGQGDAEQEGGEEAEGAAPDVVDWEAALRPTVVEGQEGEGPVAGVARQERGGGRGRGAQAASAVAQAGGGLDAAEARRVAAMADLGLRFAEAAAEGGHLDAARSALGVLVRYAPQLPPPLLEDLVYRMGQCSMTESARNLARAVTTAPTDALQDPGVAALLAALVGGRQGKAVAGTLQAAGLSHLAAVYGAVWGSKDAVGAVTEWQRELAAAGAVDAPAGMIAITPPLA